MKGRSLSNSLHPLECMLACSLCRFLCLSLYMCYMCFFLVSTSQYTIYMCLNFSIILSAFLSPSILFVCGLLHLSQGQAKLYLSLVPTIPKGGPIERCWSSWGADRRLPEELKEPLPSCGVFVTLADLRVTFSETQALCLWKWLEYYFLLYGKGNKREKEKEE